MEFTRRERGRPLYNSNLRRFIYGLDADLITLELATHEAHFSIVCEVVLSERGGQRTCTGDPLSQSCHKLSPVAQASRTSHTSAEVETLPVTMSSEFGAGKPFFMVQAHLLREYLHHEHNEIQRHLTDLLVKWNTQKGYTPIMHVIGTSKSTRRSWATIFVRCIQL